MALLNVGSQPQTDLQLLWSSPRWWPKSWGSHGKWLKKSEEQGLYTHEKNIEKLTFWSPKWRFGWISCSKGVIRSDSSRSLFRLCTLLLWSGLNMKLTHRKLTVANPLTFASSSCCDKLFQELRFHLDLMGWGSGQLRYKETKWIF